MRLVRSVALIGLFLILAGCQRDLSISGPTTLTVTPSPLAHHHEPPHGGSMVVLGEEVAHLELVLDSSTGTLTAYVLDSHAQAPLRLPGKPLRVEISGGETLELLPLADELTGETKEETSTFRAQSKALEGSKGFAATLPHLEVRGQTFEGIRLQYPATGEVPEEHHDHDHDHHEHEH